MLLPLALGLVLPVCSRVSVGADNRYGYARGEAMMHFPLETKSTLAPPQPYDAMLLSGQVLSVQDGNTISVKLQDRTENVRLIGIEVPKEDRGPWERKAKEALSKLVDGKIVTLETDVIVQDQEGRLQAHVYVDRVLVNAEMLRQGQAFLEARPPNVAHLEEYTKAQAEARDAGRGVWERAH